MTNPNQMCEMLLFVCSPYISLITQCTMGEHQGTHYIDLIGFCQEIRKHIHIFFLSVFFFFFFLNSFYHRAVVLLLLLFFFFFYI